MAKLLLNVSNEFYFSFDHSRKNENPTIIMFKNAMSSFGYDVEKTSAFNVSELLEDLLITSLSLIKAKLKTSKL